MRKYDFRISRDQFAVKFLAALKEESLLEISKDLNDVRVRLVSLLDFWHLHYELWKPLFNVLINIQLVLWEILEDTLTGHLVVVEITDLASVDLHEDVISHLENGQRPA